MINFLIVIFLEILDGLSFGNGDDEDDVMDEMDGFDDTPDDVESSEIESEEHDEFSEDEKVDVPVSSTKYVPPRLRRKQSEESDKELLKSIRGLLNRVSEGNVAKVSQEIQTYFDKYSGEGKYYNIYLL